MGVIGGLATAGIAKLVLGQVRSHSAATQQQPYTYPNPDPYPYDGDPRGIDTGTGVGAAIGEKAQDMKDQVSEKVGAVRAQAGHLKDQAMEQVDHLRERIPSAHELKDKAQQVSTRAHDYVGDEPLITACGALAIGAALGFLLPLSSSERRLLAPAREQIGDKLESLSHEVTDKVQAKVDDLHDKIVGEEARDNPLPPTEMKFTT